MTALPGIFKSQNANNHKVQFQAQPPLISSVWHAETAHAQRRATSLYAKWVDMLVQLFARESFFVYVVGET